MPVFDPLDPAFNFHSGEILLFDKPLGFTSFQVVNFVKHRIKKHPSLFIDGKFIQPKVGHAGTLDPLASGLLVICTGKKTKEIEKIQSQEKEYTGTFHVGATTPCFDKEKPVDQHYPTGHITEEIIEEARKNFIGKIEQTPPIFSAVKVNGERAYNLARNGEEAEIKAKTIEIKTFEITSNRMPLLDFKVVCSKGTYIRSLAKDFGLAMNSGAYLDALRRTRIGSYKVENAFSLEQLNHPRIHVKAE